MLRSYDKNVFFFFLFLSSLRRFCPPLNPWFYDAGGGSMWRGGWPESPHHHAHKLFLLGTHGMIQQWENRGHPSCLPSLRWFRMAAETNKINERTKLIIKRKKTSRKDTGGPLYVLTVHIQSTKQKNTRFSSLPEQSLNHCQTTTHKQPNPGKKYSKPNVSHLLQIIPPPPAPRPPP